MKRNLFVIELNKLSVYRTALMGLAALMIIICHCAAFGVKMSPVMEKICSYGNFGVDIFLLLSGLGCYFSLEKHRDLTVKSFYKRRFLRIAVPYLLIYIPLNLVLYILGLATPGKCLLSILALEYWFFHSGAWYVSLMAVLYLVAPGIYRVMISRYRLLFTVFSIVILTLLCAIDNPVSGIQNFQWAFSRVPSFIIGMAIAGKCMQNLSVSVLWTFVPVLLYLVLHKVFPSVFWGWLVTPFLLYLCIQVLGVCPKNGPILKCFNFMGNISLESYLTNIALAHLLNLSIPLMALSPVLLYGRYLEYFVVVAAGIPFALLVRKSSERLFYSKG